MRMAEAEKRKAISNDRFDGSEGPRSSPSSAHTQSVRSGACRVLSAWCAQSGPGFTSDSDVRADKLAKTEEILAGSTRNSLAKESFRLSSFTVHSKMSTMRPASLERDLVGFAQVYDIRPADMTKERT